MTFYRVDVDAELEKIDQDDADQKAKVKSNQNVLRNKPSIPHTVDSTSMTAQEKLLAAEREKDKGNEVDALCDVSDVLLVFYLYLPVMVM